MVPTPFDLAGLSRAIEAEREDRGLTWAALSGQVGVAVSTIRRYRRADDAEADGVLALVRWLGVAPEEFVPNSAITGDRLRAAGDEFVRVDMERVATAEGSSRGAHGQTRTSIQNLVRVAQSSGRTIASLTRLSET